MVHPLQTNKRTGQQFGGVSAVSVPSHNVLTDLTTGDDHTQYVRTDGTRAGWTQPTATPAAGAVPIADGSGKLDGWITAPSPTDLGYTAATRVLTSSTGTDVTLPLVSSTDAGLAPASGGGTANFLRADGTWAAPGGGGGVSDHGLLTGLADDDHPQYLNIDDYQQTTVANPDQCYAANCRTGVALATLALTANRIYWIPFVAPTRGGTIADVRIQVTTGASSTNVTVGLYNCASLASGNPDTSDFRPVGSALASAVQSTAATGSFTLAMSYAMSGGRLYWMCVMSSGTATIRALSTNETDMNLGFTLPSGTTSPSAITYWYNARTYSLGMPTGLTGTETYTNGTGSAPAIFYTLSA